MQTTFIGYIDLSGNHFIISSHVYFNLNELPERLTDPEREVIVRKLATSSQIDLVIVMPKDSEGKKLPQYLQFSKSANGRDKQKRDWWTYSPSMDALYCVPCMLFSHNDLRKASTSALNTKEGYKTADLKWRPM